MHSSTAWNILSLFSTLTFLGIMTSTAFTLEKDRYIRIMGRGANWFCYVDDVLVIMPKNVNVENNKLRMLNAGNECIQFTVE